jgi:NADPH-dependent 2,4-dienoyl-CoA reductase/sulfur reductase-like enzyme
VDISGPAARTTIDDRYPTAPADRRAAAGMMGLVGGRVLVVGAGIAGLALAQALHRRGIAATVVERLAGPLRTPVTGG